MASNMIPPATAPDFLARAGWKGADIRPLAGDASFRRYFRVHHDGRQAVLMDAPPPHEDPRPFIDIAGVLRDRDLSAPEILASDLTHGLVLLEDFGDRLVRPVVDQEPGLEHGIYETACDILTELATMPAPDHIPPYDDAVMLREVNLFPEWYAPATGLYVDAASFAAAWRESWAMVEAEALAKRVLVLRDYHAENLLLLDRPGLQRLGLLDFQDALAGHAAYDLVSLLQDARRDVDPALEAAMLTRYIDQNAIANADTFRAHYAVLGAQRNTKILGIFTRLWQRDGKPHYLGYQPRVWAYLLRDLAHPALAPVKSWFDAHVPETHRAAHWREHVTA
jgi:aminoglycoside/choline kinase family phosphotransferase